MKTFNHWVIFTLSLLDQKVIN